MKTSANLTLFSVALICSVPADTITEDFESATAPAVPTGWTIIGDTSVGADGSYATTAGTGNPGQSGNFDWTGSNTAAPNVYMVNSGSAFDATQSITGSFDFYVAEDGNYSFGNFILGDVQDGLTGSAGEFLNVDLRERTFGARANILDGAGVNLFNGSGNNQYRIDTNQWISATFSWTPTSGTTGDFSFSWTYPSQPNRGPMTAIGHTFDSASVFFGFGTGDSPVRFDNISITGTPVGATPADPEITSISVSGNTATITMTGDDSVPYWCASSADLTGFSTAETILETGTVNSITNPFNTTSGSLTFDVDVTGRTESALPADSGLRPGTLKSARCG